MQPFPERLVEVGLAIAGIVGALILIAPNFGIKPKQLVDGWRFPVKPTCLLLYYLALGVGIGSVAFSASLLLMRSASLWFAWMLFAFGFAAVPIVLADWPEPLILDGQGLLEGRATSRRIRWKELTQIRMYRDRCDRGLVIQGVGGKELVIPNIAYDSKAVLDCLLHWQRVPYFAREDEAAPLSILSGQR
jgi:hypothetical protein